MPVEQLAQGPVPILSDAVESLEGLGVVHVEICIDARDRPILDRGEQTAMRLGVLDVADRAGLHDARPVLPNEVQRDALDASY